MSGSDDMACRLWDLESGKCISTYAGSGCHRESVTGVQTFLNKDVSSPLHNAFISSSLDSRLKVPFSLLIL